MIEITVTNRHNPSMANSNLLYRLLSLICIVNYCSSNCKKKDASISQIQCYLWGLSCKRNSRILSVWNNSGCMEIPYICGETTLQELACCEINGYLKQDKGYFTITEKSRTLFRDLKDDETFVDILTTLKYIGVISDNKAKQLKKDWSYVAY